MSRKVIRFTILTILLTLCIGNIAYAQPSKITHPYGPSITNLQEKTDILKGIEEINRIRADLFVIDIRVNSSTEELKTINDNLERYIGRLRTIRANLARHSDIYKDSISDVFFSEQIIAICDCYIISIKHQQLLIAEIRANSADASKLFYSSYMAPIYYYITQGDLLISYTETFITVS